MDKINLNKTLHIKLSREYRNLEYDVHRIPTCS